MLPYKILPNQHTSVELTGGSLLFIVLIVAPVLEVNLLRDSQL